MTRSFAEFAVSTPDTDIPLLRELLSIDMRIPESTKFSRGQCGSLSFEMAPGPLHWSRQVEWPWVLRNGDFRPEQRVLEVGGSYTCLQYYLMQLRAVVTNIDLDYEALEAAGRNCWHFEDDRTERIRHEKMDARELRWKSSFDRVICVSTIEHIESREGRAKAIDEIVRVLKPGGLLLLTFDVFLKPEESELGECEMHAILERLGIDPATLAGQQVHVGSVDGRDVLVCMVKYCKEDK